MPFSFAIFSADWPMLRPVDGSAMAGVSGTRSRGRMLAKAESRAPSDSGLRWASTSARAMLRLCEDRHVGQALGPAGDARRPRGRGRIADATSAIAWLAEAQARFTVWAGTSFGRPAPSTASRARFGAFTDGTTWPMTTAPTEPGSTSVRSSSSRTQALARSTAVRSRKTVPERAKGVRQPATMATRRSDMEF